jgi:hypothetical protein
MDFLYFRVEVLPLTDVLLGEGPYVQLNLDLWPPPAIHSVGCFAQLIGYADSRRDATQVIAPERTPYAIE